MKKALLVGNGFTSNLIESFKNEPMMKEFYKRVPEIIDRIEKKFDAFRNLDLSNSDLFNISVATFCGDNLVCGNSLYTSDDGIHFKESIRVWIIEKLRVLGFSEPEKTYKEYFESYGLIYSINYNKIVGVETYLKVIHMFMKIGVL